MSSHTSTHTSGTAALDERSQRLLRMLVETYIDEGTPVASRRLANQPGMNVSPATVRNIMADLDSKGLVASPHTSAGKVPTQAGFRFFVDSLVSFPPLNAMDIEQLQHQLDPDLNRTDLVASASHLLSGLTQMAGLVTVPRREAQSLRQVEFLPLSGNRILSILVVNEREVQNRVLHVDRDYTDVELNQLANYINQEFGGESLPAIRDGVLASMRQDKHQLDTLMQQTLNVVSKAFDDDLDDGEEPQMVVAGETNLISIADDAELDSVKQLFEAFYHKRDILDLLDRCMVSPGVQLFIGEEAGRQFMGDVSLVTASYQIEGRTAGVLGVIGPTRMAYQRVIPLVDITARMLGSALASD